MQAAVSTSNSAVSQRFVPRPTALADLMAAAWMAWSCSRSWWTECTSGEHLHGPLGIGACGASIRSWSRRTRPKPGLTSVWHQWRPDLQGPPGPGPRTGPAFATNLMMIVPGNVIYITGE
jgi:hypothetical protein